MLDPNSTLFKIILIAPPFALAIILHEIAHGYVADKLGDPTAKMLGRLTLNPIKHIDPFMSVILPALLIFSGSPIIFGGAKPVPVNVLNLQNPKRDMAWVAVAGPITNFILAILCYLVFINLTLFEGILHLLPAMLVVIIASWAFHGVLINLVLGLFNLLPVPPLDGGRIMVGILPQKLARKYAQLERYGLLIVIALLYTGIVQDVLGPVLEHTFRHLQEIVKK